MNYNLCGIYKIVNLQNNKMYIGQSIDIKKRIIKHISELKNNRHGNEYLQFAWNKYGESFFKFEIIELTEREKLNERENYWMTKLNTLNENCGYNIESVDMNNKRIISQKTKEKISKKLKNRPTWNKGKSLSESTKKKLSLIHKGRIPWNKGISPSEATKKKLSLLNKGRKLNLSDEERLKRSIRSRNRIVKEETRKKISLSLTGRKMSEESKIKLSKSLKGVNTWKKGCTLSDETKKKISNSLKGRKVSEETKKKLSLALKGHPALINKVYTDEQKEKISQNSSKEFCIISPSGEIIKSKNLKKFCLINNLNDATMNKVIHGLRKQHKGWKAYNTLDSDCLTQG